MSFGALVGTGSGNTLLSATLAECLIEIRIEQSIDAPTRFGIRVREDISEGEPMARASEELKADRMVTVAVPGSDGLICLVRGPITDAQTQYTLGGPGSFHQVQGTERLIEMGRECYQHAWEGRASDAAKRILGSNGYSADVQDTDKNYGASTETLNQRGTDLDFLRTIAKENGFFLWVSSEASLAGTETSGSLNVTETAHFKTSPERALGPGGAPPSIASISLAPNVKPSIRAGASDECANNVTRFEAREDVERPTSATVVGIDASSVKQEKNDADDKDDAIGQGEHKLTDVTGLKRTLCVTGAGSANDVKTRAAAALADAGWFITATASTTAYMLGGVLQPHDIVQVEGIGSRHSGPYRVRKVTHVINAADHFMDLELQRNTHGEK